MLHSDGERIVAFYEQTLPDDRGRFLEDILQFPDARLESVHDFIQWLFPLREPSGANSDAPRLDDAAIEQFRMRADLRDNLVRALDRMLAFYGFARDGDRIVKSDDFTRHAHWITPGNHNHLRLTRMLKSLTVLGNQSLARSLYECLLSVYDDERRSGRDGITPQTFTFWEDAVRS